MANYDQDELVRSSCRRQVAEAAKALDLALRMNEARPQRQRVACLTEVAAKEDGGVFVAVGDPAHRMGDLFTEMFRRRPELRSVVQDALDGMYKVDMGFDII